MRTAIEVVHPRLDDESRLTRSEKVELLTGKFREILEIIGLDLRDDSLVDTPKRLAKMYVNELFKGLQQENFPRITTIQNSMAYRGPVVVRDIKIMSLCEHHFAPIHGSATISYYPKKKVIGLSKLNRIADFFARRPQVQERLTKQIADCLQEVLETDDVAVFINARHYCVISRGIEDQGSTTSTSDLRGVFETSDRLRQEFWAEVQRVTRER